MKNIEITLVGVVRGTSKEGKLWTIGKFTREITDNPNCVGCDVFSSFVNTDEFEKYIAEIPVKLKADVYYFNKDDKYVVKVVK